MPSKGGESMSNEPKKPGSGKLKLRKMTAKDLNMKGDQASRVQGGVPCRPSCQPTGNICTNATS